jgi:hypothetical protein
MKVFHGKSGTRVYLAWTAMRGRCYSPSNAAFANYGGRGITVCDRWHSFENFFADMGYAPPKLTLERLDNDKGYSPENCVWASRTAQSRNRRNLHQITIGSETRPLSEWVEKIGAVSDSTALWRIAAGWEPERAIRTPKITKRKCIPRGQRISDAVEPRVGPLSLSEAIAASGLAHDLVMKRLGLGWSVEDALSCPPRKGRRIRIAA